jgi:hypothetical protein
MSEEAAVVHSTDPDQTVLPIDVPAQENLSVRELHRAVYQELVTRIRGPEIHFTADDAPRAVISDDSDHHRTRRGYCRYEHAMLVRIGTQDAVLALGTAEGSYPAEPYVGDIAIVRVHLEGKDEAEVRTEVADRLAANYFFERSLVVFLANGALGPGGDHRLKETMKRYITFFMAGSVASPPVEQEGILTLDLKPIYSASARFRPDAPKRLVDAILSVLQFT